MYNLFYLYFIRWSVKEYVLTLSIKEKNYHMEKFDTTQKNYYNGRFSRFVLLKKVINVGV